MPKDLLYKPSLGYQKNYYTDGKFDEDLKNKIDIDDPILDKGKEDIIDQLLNDVNYQINFLPNQLIDIYLPPYIGMKNEYEYIKNEINNNKDDDTNEDDGDKDNEPSNDNKDNNDNKPNDFNSNSSNDKDNPSDNYYDDTFNPNKNNDTTSEENYPISNSENEYYEGPDKLFDRNYDIYIDIKDPSSDPVTIIKNSYYTNFLDIYEDYLNKMKEITNNYIFTTMQTVKQTLKDTSEIIEYNTTELKNKNLSHLTDYIIKSDIMIGQILRLHKKMFNIDETILHIKNIRLAKEQSLRYNSIKELEQKTFLDVDSNVLLKESVRVAEKKYEENFYALYKYLNSSVILLDESLKTIIKQDKARIIINRNEERDR